MGREIERKFLVGSDAWRGAGTGTPMRQAYLSLDPERTVRVRVSGGKAWLTVKGLTTGAARDEFEYQIPAPDAEEMIARLRTGAVVEKTRTTLRFKGRTWEVDEFAGENAGLVLAEVELPDEETPLELPPWAALEVTDDPRYYNSGLATNPWPRWGRA